MTIVVMQPASDRSFVSIGMGGGMGLTLHQSELMRVRAPLMQMCMKRRTHLIKHQQQNQFQVFYIKQE